MNELDKELDNDQRDRSNYEHRYKKDIVKKPTNKEELLEARKKAYHIWSLYHDSRSPDYKRLAKDTGLTIEQLKKYEKKDRWVERLQKDKEMGKFDSDIQAELGNILYEPGNPKELDELQRILDESGLRDQIKLFIMYYLQSYNTKWAATQAGYARVSAHTRGNYLLRDPKVMKVLNQIKQLMHENIYLRTHDIIDEYIRIAFVDITDYVEFEGNRVTLKSSDTVDGRMITEVKQGREGITIKMADKMKALERLEKIFDVIPDRRLVLEQQKFELTKRLAEQSNEEGSKVTIINDIG